ncbi:MAG: ATP-dependent Clp protease ATP-binding subunit [Candidatus Xenobia bacterium]
MSLSNSANTRAMEKRAEAVSTELRHLWLSTEHYWVAAMESSARVQSVMQELGLNRTQALEAVAEMVEIGDGKPLWEGMPRAPRLEKVLKMAVTEAEMAKAKAVEPEHVVAAMLREGRGVAARILAARGADLKACRERLLQGEAEEGEAPAAPASGKKDEKLLKKFGRELVALAREGKFDPVVGRNDEIREAMGVLARKNKNNPVLVGEAGVGKTAVVLGLAQRIAAGNVPESMKNKQIWEITMSAMVAGAGYRGEFEERLQNLVNEVMAQPDTILFVDELHTIVGAGDSGPLDASNILKPKLASGELSMIGATTNDEYHKYIEKDPALERRFQPVLVKEPGEDVALQILQGLKPRYEKHHGVRFTPDALQAAIKLSVRYLPDRHLPDKAIDLIDEAAARMKTRSAAIDANDPYLEVTEDVIAEVVAAHSGIPVGQVTANEEERLLHLEDELHKRVIGQHDAVTVVAETVRMHRMGLSSPNRPAGVFMFVGPTGVGKTELAKALAECLFGSDKELVRLDMSEYSEKAAVNRLIGSPPGYIGHDEEGQLTKAVHRKPFSVVLLDEIEKAHAEVYDTFLQVFDDGRLTDNKGRTVNFTNTIIIMTSNLGMQTKDPLGNVSLTDVTRAGASDVIMGEVKKFFRPEFINRIDNIVMFTPLSLEQVNQIAELMIDGVRKMVKAQHGVNLGIDPSAREAIVAAGFNPAMGARPLRRALETLLIKPLSVELIHFKRKGGSILIVMGRPDGALAFSRPEDLTPDVRNTAV